MTASEGAFVVRSTKVPLDVASDLDELAERRLLTTSALLRSLIDSELATERGVEVRGEVETATLAEIEAGGFRITGARAAAALNLARRLDTDPTSAAPVTAQLRALLDEITGPRDRQSFNRLHWLRLTGALDTLGFDVVHRATGQSFDISADWSVDGFRTVMG